MTSKRLPSLALVLSALTLAGCATSGSITADRRLPPLPAYVKIVRVPDPQPAEDARLVAARERAGRAEANRIIAGMSVWYQGVVTQYAGGKSRSTGSTPQPYEGASTP